MNELHWHPLWAQLWAPIVGTRWWHPLWAPVVGTRPSMCKAHEPVRILTEVARAVFVKEDPSDLEPQIYIRWAPDPTACEIVSNVALVPSS